MNQNVISVEQFINRAVDIIPITPFREGDEPIFVKCKPISLVGLLAQGKIPNTLTSVVSELFGEGAKHPTDHKQSNEELEKIAVNTLQNSKEATDGMVKLLDFICEQSLLEPTFSEIGDYMTDSQKIDIFNYTQGGVKKLESFRKEQEDSQLIADV